MSEMFDSCNKLKNVDLSNFIIKKDTDKRWMFFGCRNQLRNLEFPSSKKKEEHESTWSIYNCFSKCC